jgi:dTDP-glucose 4,6-dehydratase
MRVLIAGGGGFIGSHLVDRFLDRGDTVVAIDSFVTGRRQNLDHVDVGDRFELVEHDITLELPDLGRFDAVLNFASPASPDDFATMPIQILETGSIGNRRLLDLATACGARFLLASTSEVYGDPQVHPQSENYVGSVDPVGPRSCYDEAKRFAEAMTVAYGNHRGTDVAIARIFNTYGERMAPFDGRVVSTFIVQALAGLPLSVHGDGTQTRSFCHVSDLVEGLVALFDSDRREPVNIGEPTEVTVTAFAEMVIDVTGSTSLVTYTPLPDQRGGDPQRRCPDIGLAHSILGWEPVVSLVDGLTATVEYFQGVERLG